MSVLFDLIVKMVVIYALFFGVKFGLKVLLRVKELTFCISAL